MSKKDLAPNSQLLAGMTSGVTTVLLLHPLDLIRCVHASSDTIPIFGSLPSSLSSRLFANVWAVLGSAGKLRPPSRCSPYAALCAALGDGDGTAAHCSQRAGPRAVPPRGEAKNRVPQLCMCRPRSPVSHWLTVAHRMRRVRFQAQNTVGESARGRYVAMRLTYVCLVCVLVGGCVGVGVGCCMLSARRDTPRLL